MRKCLIVINRLSGRASRIDKDKLLAKFGVAYDVTVREISDKTEQWSPDGYDLVVA